MPPLCMLLMLRRCHDVVCPGCSNKPSSHSLRASCGGYFHGHVQPGCSRVCLRQERHNPCPSVCASVYPPGNVWQCAVGAHILRSYFYIWFGTACSGYRFLLLDIFFHYVKLLSHLLYCCLLCCAQLQDRQAQQGASQLPLAPLPGSLLSWLPCARHKALEAVQGASTVASDIDAAAGVCSAAAPEYEHRQHGKSSARDHAVLGYMG